MAGSSLATLMMMFQGCKDDSTVLVSHTGINCEIHSTDYDEQKPFKILFNKGNPDLVFQFQAIYCGVKDMAYLATEFVTNEDLESHAHEEEDGGNRPRPAAGAARTSTAASPSGGEAGETQTSETGTGPLQYTPSTLIDLTSALVSVQTAGLKECDANFMNKQVEGMHQYIETHKAKTVSWFGGNPKPSMDMIIDYVCMALSAQRTVIPMQQAVNGVTVGLAHDISEAHNDREVAAGSGLHGQQPNSQSQSRTNTRGGAAH